MPLAILQVEVPKTFHVVSQQSGRSTSKPPGGARGFHVRVFAGRDAGHAGGRWAVGSRWTMRVPHPESGQSDESMSWCRLRKGRGIGFGLGLWFASGGLMV